MEVYRVKPGSPVWLYKAYDYVRVDAFCAGQNIPIEMEFSGDGAQDELLAVVLVEDHKPLAGCRILYPMKGVGKIERVCVVRDQQKAGYGKILIEEAEKWLRENGVKHIVINSQDRVARFYNKLGYVTNHEISADVYEQHQTQRPPIEEEKKKEHRNELGFSCVLVEKYFD